MKKAVSILLLFVFLFNVGGYYILFWCLKYHADMVLTARLDANTYAKEETIELKIPVTLPYPLQQRDFERIDGKFEYEGQHYKLVKHKLENDTVYVVCIKELEVNKLEATMKKYTKATSDPQSNSKTVNVFSKLVQDFEARDFNHLLQQEGWSRQIPLTLRTFVVISQPASVFSPPPEV